MPPSEPSPTPSRPTRPDWRAWLALIWALVFGALYARTVVEHRLPKLRAAVAPAADPARP